VAFHVHLSYADRHAPPPRLAVSQAASRRPRAEAGEATLAELDSAVVPAQPLLLAEVDGQLRVVVSIASLAAIADPFAPTADLVATMRAHIVRAASPARRRGGRSAAARVAAAFAVIARPRHAANLGVSR
jgi:hypothetical protein